MSDWNKTIQAMYGIGTGESFIGISLDDTALSSKIATLQARGDRLAEALDGAIHEIEQSDLNTRMCCDGHMCGCQGSRKGEFLVWNLREALTEWRKP